MIKAIIFDLDDTLLQTKQVKWEAIKTFGAQFYNRSISSELLTQHWGKPYTEFMSLVFANTEEIDTVIKKYKAYVAQFPNKPYPDTLETLEKLFPKYAVCILSSAAQSLVFRDMEAADLPIEKFTYIQSEEDTSAHKPDPKVFDPLIRVLAEHNISPAEMFFTGDTLYDFHAAKGAGLHFRGIADRSISREEFEKAGAQTITQVSELIEILKKLK